MIRFICGALASILLPVASLPLVSRPVASAQQPPMTDYCARLEQEIQGRKHGFLAGNLSYYVGGFHASWDPIEDETIGLTHPLYHDLRSRGTGLLESELRGGERTGRGNDYLGWEFYKDTRVLYGSVRIGDRRVQTPKPTSMRWRPDKLVCRYELDGVTLTEEKFIAANDAAVSIIKSSVPVTIEFSGRSFYSRNSQTSTAQVTVDPTQDILLILEGGTVRSRPDPGPVDRERFGPCVYDGMTTALAFSSNLDGSVEVTADQQDVQHYTIRAPCDSEGLVVAWAMDDEANAAKTAAKQAVQHSADWLQNKTQVLNQQLNQQVPYFRCSDKKMVEIYYYLWSLYLMYYIDVGQDWELEPHTQTAVNNFLGIHRYDAMFQIKVGAWLSDQPRYAYGNVLTWKHLTKNGRYRELDNGLRVLADNKGRTWHSGAYGGEMSEHVLSAWQVYQHTGDVEFLKACYEGHFKELFWKRISVFAMNEFEVAETLEAMAKLTGNQEDVAHWQQLVRRDREHIRLMFDQRWQAHGVDNYFAAPDNGMIMTNGFWAMRSKHFPKEYAQAMVESWAVNRERGFYGDYFPLAMSKQAMKTFSTPDDHSFGYTPDTAYFTLDGMFRQGMAEVASELTLNHLQNYNYHSQWQIPVAPEAYRRNGSLFGDQYSNFNAGKILLYLEGLAGLSVSIPERTLTVRPALPKQWEWMEVRLPIEGQWTTIKYQHGQVNVQNCPLDVRQ